jgi:hypothetical protein
MQSANVAGGPNARKNSMLMPNESQFTKMQLNQRLSTHGPNKPVVGNHDSNNYGNGSGFIKNNNQDYQKTNNIDTQNSIVNNGSISINNHNVNSS